METKTIRAFDLRPGNTVVYDDGSRSVVKAVGYGDAKTDGFHKYRGKTSVAFVVEFEGGRKQATHRDVPVKVSR